MRFFLLLLFAAATTAHAQEIVTLKPREGVTLSFFIANLGEVKRPCDPLAPHGFFGKEAETVDAIAAWMLKKPYRTDLD